MKPTQILTRKPIKSTKTGFLSTFFMLLFISATITGCGDDSGEKELSSAAIATQTPAAIATPTPAAVTAPAVTQKNITKKYTPTAENCGPHYEHQYMLYEKADIEQFESWQSCFPREAPLDDKEFWSEPRIMFSFYKEDYQNQKGFDTNPSLYSMRFDGSDIRLILRSDEIAGDIGHGFMYYRAVRSPNNRYIALSFDEGEQLTKVLFDLQEGSRTVLIKGGAKSNFIWTHDSENLIFYVDDHQKNYHIPTKTLTDRKIVYSSGGTLYLLNDGKTFMAARYNRLDYSDFTGNKLKTIKLPIEEFNSAHGLSLDNRYFYFADGTDAYIFDIEKQEKIYHYPDWKNRPSSSSTFLPGTNKIIFYYNKKGLVIHNVATDQMEIIIPDQAKGAFGPTFPTIINHPLLSGAESSTAGGAQ